MPRKLWKTLKGTKRPPAEPQAVTPLTPLTSLTPPDAASRVKGKFKAALARFREKSKRRSPNEVRATHQDEVLAPGRAGRAGRAQRSSEHQRPSWKPGTSPRVTQFKIATGHAGFTNPQIQKADSSVYPNSLPGAVLQGSGAGEHQTSIDQSAQNPMLGKVRPVTISPRADQINRPDLADEPSFQFKPAEPILQKSTEFFQSGQMAFPAQPVFVVSGFESTGPFTGDTKFSSLARANPNPYAGLFAEKASEQKAATARPDDTGDKPGFPNEDADGYASSSKSNISSGIVGSLQDLDSPRQTVVGSYDAMAARSRCRVLSKTPSELKVYQGAQAIAARFDKPERKVKLRSYDSEAFKTVITEIRKQNDVFRESWRRLEERLDRLENVLSGICRTGEPALEAEEGDGWDFSRGGFVVKEAESLDLIVDLTSTERPVVSKKLHTAKGVVDSTVTTGTDQKHVTHEWVTKRKARRRRSSTDLEDRSVAETSHMSKSEPELSRVGRPSSSAVQPTQPETEPAVPVHSTLPEAPQRIYWHFKSLEGWPDFAKKPAQKPSAHFQPVHSAASRRTVAADDVEGPEAAGKTLKRRKSRARTTPHVEVYSSEDSEEAARPPARSGREKARDNWSKAIKQNRDPKKAGSPNKLRRWFARWAHIEKESEESIDDLDLDHDLNPSYQKSPRAVETKVRIHLDPAKASGLDEDPGRKHHIDELNELIMALESEDVAMGHADISGEAEWRQRYGKLLRKVDSRKEDKVDEPLVKDFRDVSVDASVPPSEPKPEARKVSPGRQVSAKDGIFWFDGEKPPLQPFFADSLPVKNKDRKGPGPYAGQMPGNYNAYGSSGVPQGPLNALGQPTAYSRRLAILEERRRAVLKARLRGVVTRADKCVSSSALSPTVVDTRIRDHCRAAHTRAGLQARYLSSSPSTRRSTNASEDAAAILRKRLDTSPLRSWYGSGRYNSPLPSDLLEADFRPYDAYSTNRNAEMLPVRKRRTKRRREIRNLQKERQDEGEDRAGAECRPQLNESQNPLTTKCKQCKTKERAMPPWPAYTAPSKLLGVSSTTRPMVREPQSGIVVHADDDQLRILLPELRGKDLNRMLIEVERNEAAEMMTEDGRCVPVLSEEVKCSEKQPICKKRRKSLPKSRGGKSCDPGSKHVGFCSGTGKSYDHDECALRRLSSHSLEELIFKGCGPAEKVLVDRLSTEIASLGVADNVNSAPMRSSYLAERLARQSPLKAKKWQRNRTNASSLIPENVQSVHRSHTEERRHQCLQPEQTVSMRFNSDQLNREERPQWTRHVRQREHSHRRVIEDTAFLGGTNPIDCDQPRGQKPGMKETSRHRHKRSPLTGSSVGSKRDWRDGTRDGPDLQDVSGFIARGKRDGKLVETFMFNPMWASGVSHPKTGSYTDVISKLFPSPKTSTRETGRADVLGRGSSLRIHSSLKLCTPDGRSFHLDSESLENTPDCKMTPSSPLKDSMQPCYESPPGNKNYRMEPLFEEQRRESSSDRSSVEASDIRSVKSQKEALNWGLAAARIKADFSSDTSRADYNELYTVFSEKLYFSKNDHIKSQSCPKPKNLDEDHVHVETIKIQYPFSHK